MTVTKKIAPKKTARRKKQAVKKKPPMKTKRPVGRPRKWTPDKDPSSMEKIEAWAGRGLTEEQIAHALGIGKDAFIERKDEYPEIPEAIQRGRAKAIGNLSNAAFEAATGQLLPAHLRREAEAAGLSRYVRGREPDGRTALNMLGRMDPENWSQERKLKISGDGEKGAVKIENTPDKAAKIIQALVEATQGQEPNSEAK